VQGIAATAAIPCVQGIAATAATAAMFFSKTCLFSKRNSFLCQKIGLFPKEIDVCFIVSFNFLSIFFPPYSPVLEGFCEKSALF